MFVLCPHCQFLVALDPATGRAPADCPRCGKPLAPTPTAGPIPGDTAPAQRYHEPPATDEAAGAPSAAQDATATPADTTVAIEADAQAMSVAGAAVGTGDDRPAPHPAATDAPQADADDGSADAEHAPADEPASIEAPRPEPAPAVEPAAPVPPRRRHLPSFAHPLRAPATRPGARSIAAIAGLALLLMLQVLLADRARLATDARWRPLLSALCGALQCELPAWCEPAAFTLLARDVRPAREGVLRVTATFRNDARWSQPWPALRLALQDVDGRTAGARTLRPDEYRDDARGRDDARVTQSGLAPGQTAHAAFEVLEPDATVVAFTFDFR